MQVTWGQKRTRDPMTDAMRSRAKPHKPTGSFVMSAVRQFEPMHRQFSARAPILDPARRTAIARWVPLERAPGVVASNASWVLPSRQIDRAPQARPRAGGV